MKRCNVKSREWQKEIGKGLNYETKKVDEKEYKRRKTRWDPTNTESDKE